jgi:hypothetical protein
MSRKPVTGAERARRRPSGGAAGAVEDAGAARVQIEAVATDPVRVRNGATERRVGAMKEMER